MTFIENEPTHPTIYRNGNNGVLRAKGFGGVAKEWKLTDGNYILRTAGEIKEIEDEEKRQNQQPIGGVIGGIGGSMFNGTEYIPIEELKP